MHVYDSAFTMSGDTIGGNTSATVDGGVFTNGTFDIKDAVNFANIFL